MIPVLRKEKKYSLLRFVLLVFLIFLFSFGYLFARSHFFWVHIPFHSGIELFGVFTALAMSYILLRRNQSEDTPYLISIALGFLAMGFFDAIHSVFYLGNRFVFLHSVSTLTRGRSIFFRLVSGFY